MKAKKTYAVFGLGRYGTAVARELVDNGMEVIAVDTHQKIVNDAAAYLPVCKCADVTDAEVISRLGIGNIELMTIAVVREGKDAFIRHRFQQIERDEVGFILTFEGFVKRFELFTR